MNIFINYRRADSQYQVDRLYEELSNYLEDAEQQLYMDIEATPLGIDYIDYIQKKITDTDVFLAVIGDEWLHIKDKESDELRLQNPNDLVRQEIAIALEGDIPVIPTILDEATVPPPKALPENISALSRRNGVMIRRRTFEDDVHTLAEGLGLTGDNRKKGVYYLPPLLGGKIVNSGKSSDENRPGNTSVAATNILSKSKNVKLAKGASKGAKSASKGIGSLWGKIAIAAVVLLGVAFAVYKFLGYPQPPPPTTRRSLQLNITPPSIATAKVGDRVAFKVTVKNTGNVQEHQIVLTSQNAQNGHIVRTKGANLNPGASFTTDKVYRVQEGDFKAGQVIIRLSAISNPNRTLASAIFKVKSVKPKPSVDKFEWSSWYDNDLPGGDGDFEMVTGMVAKNQGCAAPMKIECRTKSTKTDWKQAGQVYLCTPDLGGRCRNNQQPSYSSSNRRPCLNYEARVYCKVE